MEVKELNVESYNIEKLSKTEEEYHQFYEDELEPIVNGIEIQRSAAVERFKKDMKPVLILFAITVIAYIFFRDYASFISLGFVLYLTKVGIEIGKYFNEINKDIKNKVINKLVYFINPNFAYEKDKHIPIDDFFNSNIFNEIPDKFTGDDLIEGYIGEREGERTYVSFSEVSATKIIHYRDSEGRRKTREESILQGLFFVVDFNKNTVGKTIILPKEEGGLIYDLTARFSSNNSMEKIEKVHLENPEFMDKFAVRSDDQIQARVILTPAFMNRLIEFTSSEVVNGKEVNLFTGKRIPYFSFKDGIMYFILKTNQAHFEYNIFKKITKESLYEYFRDINLALQMVDELNLNLRLITKR